MSDDSGSTLAPLLIGTGLGGLGAHIAHGGFSAAKPAAEAAAKAKAIAKNVRPDKQVAKNMRASMRRGMNVPDSTKSVADNMRASMRAGGAQHANQRMGLNTAPAVEKAMEPRKLITVGEGTRRW